MSKIKLITIKEFTTRVRKKSFIVMTLLAPLLFVGIMIVPALLVMTQDEKEYNVAIVDNSGLANKIENTEKVKYHIVSEDLDTLKAKSQRKEFDAVAVIPKSPDKNPVDIYAFGQTPLEVKSDLKGQIKKIIETEKLQEIGIDPKLLDSVKTNVKVETFQWQKNGNSQKSSVEIAMGIGYIAAILIYMFIFMYGAYVMRGVMEEKSNRVVEILVSSVKPFELMMGKILGMALVAFTQFFIWIGLSLALFFAAKPFIIPDNMSSQAAIDQMAQQNEAFDLLSAFFNFDFGMILFVFVFFFVSGYLLYSSLFAAVGAAVDNETDTQQFMLPLVLPLVLAIVMAQGIIQNPNSSLAFWLSMIPFTSPVIMVMRVVFGVPEAVEYWELALSMIIMIASFIATTWIGAKIYRVGILMYGKKVTYKELWKWLKYKN